MTGKTVPKTGSGGAAFAPPILLPKRMDEEKEDAELYYEEGLEELRIDSNDKTITAREWRKIDQAEFAKSAKPCVYGATLADVKASIAVELGVPVECVTHVGSGRGNGSPLGASALDHSTLDQLLDYTKRTGHFVRTNGDELWSERRNKRLVNVGYSLAVLRHQWVWRNYNIYHSPEEAAKLMGLYATQQAEKALQPPQPTHPRPPACRIPFNTLYAMFDILSHTVTKHWGFRSSEFDGVHCTALLGRRYESCQSKRHAMVDVPVLARLADEFVGRAAYRKNDSRPNHLHNRDWKTLVEGCVVHIGDSGVPASFRRFITREMKALRISRRSVEIKARKAAREKRKKARKDREAKAALR